MLRCERAVEQDRRYERPFVSAAWGVNRCSRTLRHYFLLRDLYPHAHPCASLVSLKVPTTPGNCRMRSGGGRYQQGEESRRDRCGDRQQADGLDPKALNQIVRCPMLAAATWWV
jgi:hypothetical protein